MKDIIKLIQVKLIRWLGGYTEAQLDASVREAEERGETRRLRSELDQLWNNRPELVRA